MTKKFLSTFNFIAIIVFVVIFAFACKSKQDPTLSVEEPITVNKPVEDPANKMEGYVYISSPVYANGKFGVDVFKIENGKIRVGGVRKVNYYDNEEELISKFVDNPTWDVSYTVTDNFYAIKSDGQYTVEGRITIPFGQTAGSVKYGSGLSSLFKEKVNIKKQADLYVSESIYANPEKFGIDVFKLGSEKVWVGRLQKVNYYDDENSLVANFIKSPSWDVVYNIKEYGYAIKDGNISAELILAPDGKTGRVEYNQSGFNTQMYNSVITLTKVDKLYK